MLSWTLPPWYNAFPSALSLAASSSRPQYFETKLFTVTLLSLAGLYFLLHALQTLPWSCCRQVSQLQWPQLMVTGSTRTPLQNTQLQASLCDSCDSMHDSLVIAYLCRLVEDTVMVWLSSSLATSLLTDLSFIAGFLLHRLL